MSSSNKGACSIHLGNYIIQIASGAMQQNPTTKERDASQSPSRPESSPQRAQSNHRTLSGMNLIHAINMTPAANNTSSSSSGIAMASTADMSSYGRGALDFKLKQLKFLRDAEQEYITRLIKTDQQSALSVFEVNVDVFESYLLKVSGRALAATAHLNLNLTSSLQSHMRIFNTQQEHVPFETQLKEEAKQRIQEHKERRMRRRMRYRRGTATFGAPVQEDKQDPQPNFNLNESPAKNSQPPTQTQHSLFVLHPIAEENSQLQLSSDQIENSPSNKEPLRLNSELNIVPPQQMLDSLNEREGEGDQEILIEEDNEEYDFDRAGAAAMHDIIVHKPPEEKNQETMMFGHSREFDETVALQNISPIPTALVTMAPSVIQLPEEAVQVPYQEDTKQQIQNEFANQISENLTQKQANQDQDQSQPHLELPAQNSDSRQVNGPLTSQDEEIIQAQQEMIQSNIEKSIEIHQDLAQNQHEKLPVAISNNFDAQNIIKIGEHTIGDPYQSIGDTSLPNILTANQEAQNEQNPNTESQGSPEGHPNQTFELGEQYTINDVTELDNTNPFREKSVASYLVGGNTNQGVPQTGGDSPSKEDASFGGDHSSIRIPSGHVDQPGIHESQPELADQVSNPDYGNTFEMKVNSVDQMASQGNIQISQRTEDLVTQRPVQIEDEQIQRQATAPLSIHDKTQDSIHQTQVPLVIQKESSRSAAPSNILDHTAQNHHPSNILEDHQPTLIQDKSIEDLSQINRSMEAVTNFQVQETRSVGNTPLNLTMEEPSVERVEVAIGTTQRHEPSPPEVIDAAIGRSMISEPKNELKDQSVLAMEHVEVKDQSVFAMQAHELKDQSVMVYQQNANIGTSALNISRVDEGLSAIIKNNDISKLGAFSPRLINQSINVSREMVSATLSAQDQSLINTKGYPLPAISNPGQQQPEKIQITLTAEPDKPIMVEVRGGEKEFVISSLTQHLFDILSKPKGLTILPNLDSNSSCADRASEDQEIVSPEQLGQLDSKGVFTLNNQAMKTKVKELKKHMKKEGTLPSVQRNTNRQSEIMFDSATRQEMYSGLPGLSKNSKQMTIQENRESIQNFPQIAPISKEQVIQQTGGDSDFIKVNTNNWKSKANSRSSQSGIALSPLTTSNIDEVKQDAGHTRQLSKQEPVINQIQLNAASATMRTTEEAFAPGKIIEEPPQHTHIESDLVSANVGQISAMGSIPNTLRRDEVNAPSPSRNEPNLSKESQNTQQLLQVFVQQSQESFRKLPSEEALQILQQQQSLQRSNDSINNTPTSSTRPLNQNHRSRPETANFNQAYAATVQGEQTVAEQAKQIQQMEEDLVHARQRLSMMIRQEGEASPIFSNDHSPMKIDNEANEAVLQAPETPKYKEADISIADQQASLASRLETPGADAHDGLRIQEIVNSAPAQLEQINLAPLHPTIPNQHPNGYFATESDFMMVRPESNTRLRQSGSSEINDQYLKNAKLAQHLKPTMQNTQHTNASENLINSQYGFSDQDQQLVDGDFILAEGYPMLNFMQDSRNGGVMGPTQYYDFTQSSFTPVLASSNQGGIHGGSMQLTPNAYRIRKVILPNYQNTLGNNSQMTSYGPGYHTQTTGGSPMGISNTTALYPPSHLQSRDSSQQKQLPVVKTRKRYFQTTMQNPSQSQYGINPLIIVPNGGNTKKTGKEKINTQFQGHRSLSPVRVSQKKVYYTTSYMTKKQLLQQLQQEEWLKHQHNTLLSPHNTSGHLSLEDYQQFAFYSQSPQPKIKASPYMSDDEFKILHDFYDITCEPTGMQRGGLPLMKVKRIHKPKNKNLNMFNFSDDPNNISLPRALSSLQIFYPQFQTNEMLSKTLSTPSKWFDRFNQSTKNLNHTIQNMHKEHNRKLRSYSISSFSSAVGGGQMPGIPQVNDSLRQRSGSQQALFVKRQTPIAVPGMAENGQAKANMNANGSRKFFSSTKDGMNSTYMPPLKKIYTQTMKDDLHREKYSRTTGGTQKKGTKLPPKPSKQKGNGTMTSMGITGGTTASSTINGTTLLPQGSSGKKDKSFSASQKQLFVNGGLQQTLQQQPHSSDQQQQLIQIPPNSIIYANHNQQLCFGVNIITKSDK